ncbi:MAG: mechanosensitive ion channel [Wenzhouxiangella sp.]|nr:mechanosensitive ion channel [Wenzhouxiangella sp.]
MLRASLFYSVFAALMLSLLLSAPASAETAPTLPAEAYSELQQLQRQLAELRQNRSDLESQYEVLSGSKLLHRVLQEQRASLPRFERRDYNDQLAELRLELFYVQRALRVADTAETLAQLEVREAELQQSIGVLVEFTQLQKELSSEVRAFSEQLDEYLFWTPSNPPMSAKWWLAVPRQLSEQFQRVQAAAVTMVRQADLRPSWTAIVLALLLIIVMWQRPKLRRKMEANDKAVACDAVLASPWVIVQSLMKMAVYVLPVSLTLLLLGQFLGTNASIEHLQPGAVFTALAFAMFMLSFLRKMLQRNGFAEVYFQWPEETCSLLRQFIVRLAIVLLPLTFILAFAAQQTSYYAVDVIGPIALLFAGLYLFVLVVSLFRRLPNVDDSVFMHRFVGGVILLLPISLVWMVSTGYYFTALKLSGYYLATFYVMSIWVICEVSVRRGVQLSSARLRAAREERLANAEPVDVDRGEAPPTPEEDDLDIDLVEQQSLRLGRFFLLVAFSFVLYSVWSDALITLHYLDSQFIWQTEQGTSYIPISFGALLSAISIVVISVVLVRNLPGLLEVTVLSRLKLEMGTAYAVTSLLNYVLVSVAVISVLASLGVKWDQLQWLAAGLTVGLGFGLQEIFGNFISGLILFFERPVRVGDIVTLDNLSGRVSKIKIRATVITDFDRRDIIVPNRHFITGQFVNWSLSNTVTRITVRVGVAYGSDLDKTREILLDIAEKEPRVLDDPAPQVLFLTFGESTLDHELRVHVGGLSDRNPSIDAMNREIDRRFKEAGIEIAFNQIDVHFRNHLGVEKLVESSDKTINKEGT